MLNPGVLGPEIRNFDPWENGQKRQLMIQIEQRGSVDVVWLPTMISHHQCSDRLVTAAKVPVAYGETQFKNTSNDWQTQTLISISFSHNCTGASQHSHATQLQMLAQSIRTLMC